MNLEWETSGPSEVRLVRPDGLVVARVNEAVLNREANASVWEGGQMKYIGTYRNVDAAKTAARNKYVSLISPTEFRAQNTDFLLIHQFNLHEIINTLKQANDLLTVCCTQSPDYLPEDQKEACGKLIRRLDFYVEDLTKSRDQRNQRNTVVIRQECCSGGPMTDECSDCQ